MRAATASTGTTDRHDVQQQGRWTMRAAVAESFTGFTRDLEGPTNFMYLDVRGFVTTGYGNLIDDTVSVCALPWRHPDGTFANRDEVIAAWATVRGKRGQRDPHGVPWTDRGGVIFAQFTTLRLDAMGVDALVRGVMSRNDEALKRRYPEWESWPACAQLACMSLAWACGTGYDFPAMDRALANRDFAEASREIEMTPVHNPGNNLKRRNAANETLMANAQRVEAYHLDPSLIEWTAVIGVHDLDTVPAIDVAPDSEPTTSADEPTIHVLRYNRGPDDPPDEAA